MQVPELRQVSDLGEADFQRIPVWINVHTADYEMPWYESCNEATFRPYTEALPVAAAGKFLLARASFALKDGRVFQGYISPVAEDWDEPLFRKTSTGETVRLKTFSERNGGSPLAILQLHQPNIFVDAHKFPFWGGRRGVSAEVRAKFYDAVSTAPEEIFPIRYQVDSSAVQGVISGELAGFYRSISGQAPVLEF